MPTASWPSNLPGTPAISNSPAALSFIPPHPPTSYRHRAADALRFLHMVYRFDISRPLRTAARRRGRLGPLATTRYQVPGSCFPRCLWPSGELVRFLRQRHRIIGAGHAYRFWLLIGGVHGAQLPLRRPGGGNYLQSFFPGTVLMIRSCSPRSSATISHRRPPRGFLQSVLVAPVPRMRSCWAGSRRVGAGIRAGGCSSCCRAARRRPPHRRRVGVGPARHGGGLLALTALGFCIACDELHPGSTPS